VLRVLYLNDTSRNGGPGRTLFTILKHSTGLGIERTVVLPREGLVADLLRSEPVFEALHFEPGILENPFEPWSRAIERDDFDAHVLLKSVRATGNAGRAARGIARLVRRIKQARIDVIFCNGTSACFLGALLGRLTGVKVLWHVFYSSVADALVPLHRRLARSNWVTQIVCVSACTTTQFSHCMHKVAIQHDAIDAKLYAPDVCAPADLRARLRIPNTSTIFGSQGRIVPKKGYRELISAFSGVRNDAHLVIVGDTPEDTPVNHLHECQEHARTLGQEGRVHFLGFCADVRPYLSAFDVVVVPSVYEDPLPRAVMEAMAMQKPVVAHAVGGIPEMVAHERTGLLSAPEDSDGLVRCMQRYAQNPEEREAHGAAGRQRILAEFEAHAHAQKLKGFLARMTD
jgi:glycosyltransferase involved in cell wall biosynthesis